MSKITISMGGTFSLSDNSREYIRPQIEITGIDTEGDVEAQLEQAKPVINRVWSEVVEMLLEKVDEIQKAQL